MTERTSTWRPIATAPRDGHPILASFRGQFGWVFFVAMSWGSETSAPGYAEPTHWACIPDIDIEDD